MRRKILFSLLVAAAAGLVALGAGARKDGTGGSGLLVPEAWRGTWEVTVSYRDRATGALVAEDITTAAVCPGELVVPPLLSTALRCTGQAAEGRININCGAKYSPRPGCNVFVEARLDSRRVVDSWNGTGSWTAKVVGNCEHMNFGEDVVVTGRRVSSEAACDGASASLVHRFFAHSALVPVLGGGN
jgi:hypothetical protein